MNKAANRVHLHKTWAVIIKQRRFILLAILLLLAYILIPQISALRESLQTLSEASPPYILLAIGLTFITYFFSSQIYLQLVKRPTSFKSILLIQVATALTSRLAPTGVGAAGLNVLFLRRTHTLSEALAVMVTASTAGIIVHFCLLAIVATTAPLPGDLNISISRSIAVLIGSIALAIVMLLVIFKRLRRKIIRAVSSTISHIGSYRHQPRTLAITVGYATVLSLIYVSALMACSQALGLHLPFNQIFLIYTFSVLTGAATAIPGGLVGVEAGLTSGFIAYGTLPSTALAVALLYRLITYWLPLIPGLMAFRIAQQRYF